MTQHPSHSVRSLAMLFAALGITAGGCTDPAPIDVPKPAQLSSLSIAPSAELMPAFSSATTSYTTTVPTDLPSVVVSATSKASDATIAINGLVVPPGANQSVSLGPPGTSTSIEVVVAPSKGDSVTYQLTVARLGKCTPPSGEDCCPQDYQEQPCGNGNCGKQSRTCSASGKWSEWTGCGVDVARNGQVCRGTSPTNTCDPAEVCAGNSIDCPADHVKYSVPNVAGCWDDMATTTIPAGACTAHRCLPDHGPTAQHRCEESGFKVYTSQLSLDNQAGDVIYVGWWVGGGPCPTNDGGNGWCRGPHGGGRAMVNITCLK